MADHYYAWTVPLVEADIPIELNPTDESLPDAVSHAMGLPDVLMTTSRNDWLNGALVNVVSAFNAWELAFLVQDPESLPGDRVTGFRQSFGDQLIQERWLITALPHIKMPGALAEIDRLLETAKTNPERFTSPLATDDAEYIAAEASKTYDLTEKDATHEDGDWPGYFFSFLTSLRTIILNAQAHQMAVLHVRYVYLFRKKG